MPENKSFQFAILISILFHFVVFVGAPQMSFFPSRKSLDTIKITYYKIKEPPAKLVGIKPQTIAPKLPDIKKEEILKPAPDKTSEAVKKTESKPPETIKEVKEKRFEAIVNEEEDNAKKATYISYYRSVREKIRYYADKSYLRERSTGQGEVFLSFVVASSGELLQVRIIEARSVEDSLLRNIAINSIRDASPFPSFPAGMNQYQITFNVIISFELNK